MKKGDRVADFAAAQATTQSVAVLLESRELLLLCNICLVLLVHLYTHNIERLQRSDTIKFLFVTVMKVFYVVFYE